MAFIDIRVRTTRPSDKPFKLTDGQGMCLLANPNGSKYWRFQYRFDGKQKVLVLGVYPVVSLGEVHRKRDEVKKLVPVGVNPFEKRKADKVEQSKAPTFEAVVGDWHTACRRKWSDSHSERVLKNMEDSLFIITDRRKISGPNTRDLPVSIKVAEASERLEVAS